MKVIGLTGGVGSGKTRIAKLLEEEFDAEVIYTDEIARALMNRNESCYTAVVREFGCSILDENLEIDRKKLAKIVFSDQLKLKKLDELTHPPVLAYIEKQREQLKKSKKNCLLVIETALLIEAGYDKFCDEIWYVHASLEERKVRLMESREYTEEKIEAMFASQKSEKEFEAYSTARIEHGNSVTEKELLERLKELVHKGALLIT